MSENRILHAGEFLRLCRSGHWEYVERSNASGAVVIVAVTEDDRLLLVEQPRVPMGGPVLELPAGLVGDISGAEDEDLAVAAARELEEETGYTAAHFELLTAGPLTAGLAAEVHWFYRATGLSKIGAGGGDASEQITPYAVPLTAIDSWLDARRAEDVWIDPKIYAGLYFVMRDRAATAAGS